MHAYMLSALHPIASPSVRHTGGSVKKRSLLLPSPTSSLTSRPQISSIIFSKNLLFSNFSRNLTLDKDQLSNYRPISKLRLCNFHHTMYPLSFCGGNFIQILRVPRAGASNKRGVGKEQFTCTRFKRQYLENGWR